MGVDDVEIHSVKHLHNGERKRHGHGVVETRCINGRKAQDMPVIILLPI